MRQARKNRVLKVKVLGIEPGKTYRHPFMLERREVEVEALEKGRRVRMDDRASI